MTLLFNQTLNGLNLLPTHSYVDYQNKIFLLIDPEVHPQPETYWGHVNPIGPRACYDEGKRVAETMCYAYQKQVFKFFWFLSFVDREEKAD